MAYGSIPPPPTSAPLPTLSYTLPDERRLTCFPVTRETLPEGAGEYLWGLFNEELATGKTYPQEAPVTLPDFLSYFFGATCILGIVSSSPSSPSSSSTSEEECKSVEDPTKDSPSENITIEEAVEGRGWEECLVGCYYIKPNYPGRSSHNAGFLIAHNTRGMKIGFTLAKSYLIYAPKLGYRGSVFNLVYKTNKASLAIWDKLGFNRVGLIPAAGRLITGENGEEEYVDAVVIHKSFV
ncbi:hypothetical protein FFLO_03561 [Filobasidium floriforme]|uniref:N-acetyltransferase domain-containing protein n=1 Tax=Filobasidium floriforme TaxID=5210 RepID=A0A8K0JL48_9TREE|nr:hypothetical protein FFLO_03561 [Filobasidium floriforme]